MHSPAYRRTHGIPEPNANSSHVPDSLTLDITTSNVSSSGGWTTVRGTGRGRAFRGGRGEGGGRLGSFGLAERATSAARLGSSAFTAQVAKGAYEPNITQYYEH
ncbi:hypothetical protein B0H10DRAFT_2241438 [Mycena sp. CBHHK59/15]|nr:hypothetical protein B0H10DRAFT_2241438 [Mycena sp. CBHHK59/15]